MSAMKNLDFIIQNISMGPDEYDDNRELVSAHLNGELKFNDLPSHLQNAMTQWENEEMELAPKENYHDIHAWKIGSNISKHNHG